MNNIEIFEKKTKPGKGKLIAAIVLLAMCVINELSFYMAMKGIKDKPSDFADVEKVGEYACIDVELISDAFADYSNDTSTTQSAYYVLDEEAMYIASLSSETLKKFDDIIDYMNNDTEDEPDSVRICGEAQTIPTTLRSYAVKYYNQDIEEEDKITNADFDNYFKYYLDTEKGPEDEFITQSMVAGVFLIIALIFFALYIRDGRRTKKTLTKYANELEKIKMEVSAPDTIYQAKAKIFLTKERIINVANGMEIYDYSDILWIYPYELRQNGYTTQRSIYVVTKDTKAHLLANISASKKNNLMFNELYESLIIRVPDALHGYTKENKDKVKELSKKK